MQLEYISKRKGVTRMIEEKKFFYKAKRTEDQKEVIGRVGGSHSTKDGKELSTYFYEYIGDIDSQANWKMCTVITDSIQPILNYIT